jgi:proteasome lid subunit RPN8/RPN11
MPAAWIKLNWLCHAGETEIGAMALIEDPKELIVSELYLIKQKANSVFVSFDDEAIADFFERMVDQGYKPEQFGRLWIHTHPGSSPHPSGTDEATFNRVFGRCDWAVMFILARDGATYARLRFNAGPGGQILIPVGVRWNDLLGDIDEEAWADEYAANVDLLRESISFSTKEKPARSKASSSQQDDDPFDVGLSEYSLDQDLDGRLLIEAGKAFEGESMPADVPWFEEEEAYYGRRFG